MAVNQQIQLAGIGALEEAEILAQPQHGRRFHPCDDPFHDFSDRKFVTMYRLTKDLTSELIDLLEPHMIAPTRVSALSIERKVLTSLRFFASGSYQLDIGSNINHSVSQSSVSRSIEEVSNALNNPEIFHNFVILPRNIEELQRVRTNFYLNHDFPGIVGCVDCTHIAIYPPQINHAMYPEVIYVNRKGYHSINTQLICDANMKILNVCARFPGSTNDSYIWNSSNASQYIRNLHGNGRNSFYFLGDSGYALRPWMMTPIEEVLPNTPEARYNERQKSTRSIIERCNGVLKLRFRCLLKHRVLHYAPEKASKIINSCTILHNLCIENNIPPVELGDDEGDENLGDVDFGIYENNNEPIQEPPVRGHRRINPDLAAGRLVRTRLIRNHFTNI